MCVAVCAWGNGCVWGGGGGGMALILGNGKYLFVALCVGGSKVPTGQYMP